ncbi:UNVERIFIED_ORG: hypothetical protein J2Y81_002095 [Paraburkholderia sediminicola]|nr:hypothetical protein [Paraburkholderia sediminicola]
MFVEQVRAAGLPNPERACAPALNGESGDALRFDYAWSDRKVAVQIGHESEKRHERSTRYVAEEQGWRICLFTDGMVKCGAAIVTVIAALAEGEVKDG